MRCCLVLLVAAFSLLIAPSISASAAERFADIRARIVKELADGEPAALAVAVSQGEEILWAEGFGWADRERQVRADENTSFSLASISKPLTATGLMRLVERDKLDLDRAINDYLGEAKVRARRGDAADATVRLVANHGSGLPLHWHFFFADEPYAPPSRDETIRRYANLVTAPGERFQYSNLGYGLLDYLIERISGQSYADYIHEHVFVPLGMHRSSIGIAPELADFTAARYDTHGRRLPDYTFDHPGGSEAYASAMDLVRFGMLHCKVKRDDVKSILSEDAIDAMQRPTSPGSGGDGYGIGWSMSRAPHGQRVVAHSGGMPGVATNLMLIPEEQIVVAVLTNGNQSPSRAIAQALIEEVASKPEGEEREDTGTFGLNATTTLEAPDLVGQWSGHVDTYGGARDLKLEFQADGDVHVQLGKQLRTLVDRPSSADGWFRGRFRSNLDTDDTSRADYVLHLELEREDDRLTGSLTARATSPERHFFALSHWVELQRDPEKELAAEGESGGSE